MREWRWWPTPRCMQVSPCCWDPSRWRSCPACRLFLYAGLVALFCNGAGGLGEHSGRISVPILFFAHLFRVPPSRDSRSAFPLPRLAGARRLPGWPPYSRWLPGVMSAAAIVIVLTLSRLGRDRFGCSSEDWAMLGANTGLLVFGALLLVVVHSGLQVESLAAWLAAVEHGIRRGSTGHGWTALLSLLPPLALAWMWLRRRLDTACWHPYSSARAFGADCRSLPWPWRAAGSSPASRPATPTFAARAGWSTFWRWPPGPGNPARLPRGAGGAGRSLFFAASAWQAWAGRNEQNSHDFLERMPRINQARLNAVRSYVRTQDQSLLQKMTEEELPYPNVACLASLLDVPALQASLPVDASPAARTDWTAVLAREKAGPPWVLVPRFRRVARCHRLGGPLPAWPRTSGRKRKLSVPGSAPPPGWLLALTAVLAVRLGFVSGPRRPRGSSTPTKPGFLICVHDGSDPGRNWALPPFPGAPI